MSQVPYSDALLATSVSTLAPMHQGTLLVLGRNGQCICLLSQFFSPLSNVLEVARSALTKHILRS